MKFLMVLVLVSWFWFMSLKEALAGTFNMQSISSVSTEGKQISKWWYSGLWPVFSGEAVAGSQVTITIDDQVYQINADSSGNWNYQPETAMTAGDHSVAFESEGSTISFTLTLGTENVDWNAVAGGSGEAMPAVGVATPTILLLGLGTGMVLFATMGGEVGKEKSLY